MGIKTELDLIEQILPLPKADPRFDEYKRKYGQELIKYT